ncbi:MAG TPA: PEMT/PEM2 methyltransferase family protein [Gemmatimonadales bacterium]
MPFHLQLQDLLALGYSVASRLAYVLYIGLALRRADAAPVSRDAAAPAYARFRRRAALLMYHDGIAFVVVCLLTRGTLDLPAPLGWRLAGAGLVALGVAVKLWAAATLGADGYYWRDFFELETRPTPTIAGPYRWLRNPMYTVGYVQTYGFALLVASLPGLVAAVFSQGAIVAFYRLVERPHYQRLYGGVAATTARRLSTSRETG